MITLKDVTANIAYTRQTKGSQPVVHENQIKVQEIKLTS